MSNDILEPWQNFTVVPLNLCPNTQTFNVSKSQSLNDISTSGTQSTSNLHFPGGWYSDTDIKNNPYGGSYTYRAYHDKTLNKPAYALNVVPNFQNNTWITNACTSTPNICSPNSINYNLPYNLYPKTWTGYKSNNTINEGINITVPPNCTECNGKGLVLCSTDTQMSLDSCPGSSGIYKFKNPIYVANTDNYFLNTSDKYPRGMGTCIYPADIIQDNDDLINLMALRNTNMIHPELADTLGLNYCYSPIQLGPGQGCGFDAENKLITDCNVYYFDKYSPHSLISPCVQLVDRLIETDVGRILLNEQNNQWCNKIEHTYHPLCDCIKSNVNDPNGPIKARTIYQELSDILIPRIPESIPKTCWFTPCTTYAMPIYDNAPCPEININCNNIIDNGGKSVIDHNNQYINCNNGPSGGGNDTPTVINFLTSIILPIFIILFVIGIVSLIINRVKQKPSNNTS